MTVLAVMPGKTPERMELDAVVSLWQKGEITAVEAMRRLKISKTTFYRIIRERNMQRKKE